MDFYILNQNLDVVAVIDTFVSVIWTVKYNGVGDFELYFPASDEIREVMQEDYIVTRSDSDRAMIIKTIKLTTDAENGDFMTISGVSLENILDQRIVWSQTTINGRVEDCINQLVYINCISPTLAERVIPNFKLGKYQNFSDNHYAQYDNASLLDTIITICNQYGLGFKVTVVDGAMVFQLYKGLDRSYAQDINPWVVFSPEFDNLLQSEYTHDKQNYKNVVLVGGEGEGIYKTYVSYGTASGMARHETYSDGGGVSNNNGDIGQMQYKALLAAKGQEDLLNRQIIEALDGSVDTETYKFGVDYNLGDIVQVTTKYGHEMQPRVSAITENEDESGYKLFPKWEAV